MVETGSELDVARARIAVVGSGAVGCYYGGRLAAAGHDVRFLMRSDLDAVRRHGLRVTSVAGDFHLENPAVFASSAEIGPCNVVLIALKSTSNSALPELLAPLVHPGTLLVTLQNGLGNEEFLQRHFPGQPILGGLCFVCINREAPGGIRHIAQGLVRLGEHGGPALERTHALARALREAGVPCEVDESLPRARWRKLVWNIPFNGLSIAAGGLDTAAILESAHLSSLVLDLMSEIIATAAELGHEMPANLAEDMIARTRTMTRYKPSSLIDFEEGREVELDAIWAAPCRLARQAECPMPRVEMLRDLIADRVQRRKALSSNG